jgi:hypothetical protein
LPPSIPSLPSKFRPRMKAWKFFATLSLVIAILFFAIEYSVSYYALSSIDLASPRQIQREFYYVFSPSNQILTISFQASIISRAIAPDSVSTLVSLQAISPVYFSLVLDSFNMGSPACQTSTYGCGGSKHVPKWLFYRSAVSDSKCNDNYRSQPYWHTSFHMTMRGSFQTLLESQQVVRSVSAACTAGFLVPFSTTQCVVG